VNLNRDNVGQLVASHGGRLETANLRMVLNAAAHIVDCERCQWQHRKMIMFALPLRVDYFDPKGARRAMKKQ
jgi:hypothetical protein